MFKLKKRLIKIIAQHTGKSEEQVRLDSDRDYYMSAEEAKAYGLVDEVIKSRKEVKLLDGATPPSGNRSVEVAEAALPRKAAGQRQKNAIGGGAQSLQARAANFSSCRSLPSISARSPCGCRDREEQHFAHRADWFRKDSTRQNIGQDPRCPILHCGRDHIDRS